MFIETIYILIFKGIVFKTFFLQILNAFLKQNNLKNRIINLLFKDIYLIWWLWSWNNFRKTATLSTVVQFHQTLCKQVHHFIKLFLFSSFSGFFPISRQTSKSVHRPQTSTSTFEKSIGLVFRTFAEIWPIIRTFKVFCVYSNATEFEIERRLRINGSIYVIIADDILLVRPNWTKIDKISCIL